MTSDGFLITLLLIVSGYATLVLTRLWDANRRCRTLAAELNLTTAHWDATRHKAEYLGQQLIAAGVAKAIAESRQQAAAAYARDMAAQRDDARRRLAQATWPRTGAEHG